jgi:hypothetical protein
VVDSRRSRDSASAKAGRSVGLWWRLWSRAEGIGLGFQRRGPRGLRRQGDPRREGRIARENHGEAVRARGRRGEAGRKVGEEALTGGARLPKRGGARDGLRRRTRVGPAPVAGPRGEEEKEKGRDRVGLGCWATLGPVGVFYFPFSILFPNSNQTNTI